MDNKLQELTRKLYDEGLAKGKHEAETLLADAREKAKRIVSEAWEESERIRSDAETSADDMRKNIVTELTLASRQTISKLKHQIREMVVARAISGPVGVVAIDPGFIREALVAVCGNWEGPESGDVRLEAILPEAIKDKLDVAFAESAGNFLGSAPEIVYSDGIKSGFRINSKSSGYYIDFTDESFNALLGEYLRPKAADILYEPND